MNIAELTTASLRLLHDAVIQAVKVDDETPPGQPKPHDARGTPDWREWSAELEAELTKRGEPFHPVNW